MLVTSANEMTPAKGFLQRSKRILLRGIHDRLRPLWYRRAIGGIKCLTFHYMFDCDLPIAYETFSTLKSNGHFIGTEELLDLIRKRRPLNTILFHVSIDDGFENIVTNAHPVLNSMGIPFTFFVCPSLISDRQSGARILQSNAKYARHLPLASWDQLRRLNAAGIEIGSHTQTHRNLVDLDGAELCAELLNSKAEIERQLGTECRSFAWPFGRAATISHQAIEVAKAAGYSAIFSSIRGTILPEQGWQDYLPRHHFEPGWPTATVSYYATREDPCKRGFSFLLDGSGPDEHGGRNTRTGCRKSCSPRRAYNTFLDRRRSSNFFPAR